MSTVDSVSGAKPDTQDLEDILIDQLPEDTDENRQYKEAWYRFSQKLKEIFDYYDNGNLVGAAGPRGPQGPPGPAGSDGEDGEDGTTVDEAFTKVMGCRTTTQVGDYVYQDTTTNNSVIEATDNNPPEPIIGRVKSKGTDVSCEVILVGKYTNETLGIGTIYLGSDGKGSLTQTDMGFGQVLGYSFGDGVSLVNPNLRRDNRV